MLTLMVRTSHWPASRTAPPFVYSIDTPELSQVKGRDRSVRESNAQPSTEAGMTHWTRCSAIAVVASLIAVPLCAQAHTGATNDMLRKAEGHGHGMANGRSDAEDQIGPPKQT